jgi:hypothetical protein
VSPEIASFRRAIGATVAEEAGGGVLGGAAKPSIPIPATVEEIQAQLEGLRRISPTTQMGRDVQARIKELETALAEKQGIAAVPEPGAPLTPEKIAASGKSPELDAAITKRNNLRDRYLRIQSEGKPGTRIRKQWEDAEAEVLKIRKRIQSVPEPVSPDIASFRAATEAIPGIEWREGVPIITSGPKAGQVSLLAQRPRGVLATEPTVPSIIPGPTREELLARWKAGYKPEVPAEAPQAPTAGPQPVGKEEALARWRAGLEGGKPPTEPPKPPTQGELAGMPPEEPKGPRLPTMRDVEARSKVVPPEVRAELGGQAPAMRFELEPFATVSQRWGDRFVENWWTKAEDLLGGKIGAVARTPEEIAVRRAFILRDLYASTQSDSMRAGVLEWLGRNRKVLGINGKGQAKAVEVVAGADIPKGLEQRLMHIIEHPEKYAPSAEQQVALKEATDRFTMMLRRQQAEGVNIREWQEGYWHRIVTKRPPAEPGRIGVGGGRLGARPSAARMRVFGDVEDAWNRGYRYANDIDALMAYGQDAAGAVADRNTVRTVQTLGFKPSEKVDPAIIQELTEARAGYKATRAAASLKGATTAERATALEAGARLDNAMRAMRLESRRWAERQPKVFGRIVSPEVAQEFSRYVGDLPGGTIDQVFQLLRANMIWGDLSAAGVQTQSLIWRDPVAWVKATVYSVRAMASEPTSYIVKNIDAVESGTRFGAIRAPDEFLLRTGRGMAHRFGQLPGVKQTQAAFEWDIFVAQTERWKAVQRMAKTPDDLLELASVIRAQTGTALMPGLTTAQAKALSRTWFAGRFLTSTLAVFKNATRSGVAGNEARRTLTQVFGGVAATTAAVNMVLTGKPGNFTDPDKPGFLGIRAGEGYVYAFGPFQPLFVAAARSARVPMMLAQGKQPRDRDLQAWPRFFEAKLSLPYRLTTQGLEALGVPLEAIRGEPYESPQIKGVGGWVSQLGEYMPIGPSQAVQGIKQGFYAAALEPLGMKTTPLSPYAKLTELWTKYRPQMPTDYGSAPADFAKADDLQRRWFYNLPEVTKTREAQIGLAEERGKPWSKFTQQRDTAETEFQTRMANYTGTGQEFVAQYDDFKREWGIRSNQFYGEVGQRDARNANEKAADQWWAVELDYTSTGERDWDSFFAQRKAIEDANPDLKQWLRNRELERWTDPTLRQLVTQMFQAEDVADEYYSIPAKVGMKAEDQETVRAIVTQIQATASMQGIPFELALARADIASDLKSKARIYRHLPANPARKLFWLKNPDKKRLYKTFYSDVPVEELAAVR